MKKVTKRFLNGAAAPFAGAKNMFGGARVWGWMIIPALVSSGLFAFGLSSGYAKVPIWIASILPASPGFWGAIGGFLITILAYIVFLIALLVSVLVFSKIVVIPFNGIIAERILKHRGVLKDKPFRFEIWAKRAGRQLLLALFQTVFFGVLGVVFMVLSIVPGLSVLVGFLGFLVLAFDCSDYSMEIADLSFKAKLQLLKSRFPEYAGLALVLGLTFLVPFLNLLLLPLAVAGATCLLSTFDELWIKENK